MSPYSLTMNKFWKGTRLKETPHAHWNGGFDNTEVLESYITSTHNLTDNPDGEILTTKGYLDVIKEIDEEAHMVKDIKNESNISKEECRNDGESGNGTDFNNEASATNLTFKNRLNHLLRNSKVTKQDNWSNDWSDVNTSDIDKVQNQEGNLAKLKVAVDSSLQDQDGRFVEHRSIEIKKGTCKLERTEMVSGTRSSGSLHEYDRETEKGSRQYKRVERQMENFCDTNNSVIIDVQPHLQINNTLRLNLNLVKTSSHSSNGESEKSSNNGNCSTSFKETIDDIAVAGVDTSSCNGVQNDFDSERSEPNENIEFGADGHEPLTRPGPFVNRELIRRKVLSQRFTGELSMCTAAHCPYNQWLYKDSPFPSDQTLADFWDSIYPDSSLTETQFSTVPSTLSSSVPSTPTSLQLQAIPIALPLMKFPPILEIPPPPPLPFAPTSLMTPYPIVTLPRSYRKQVERLYSIPASKSPTLCSHNLYRLFCQCLLPSMSIPSLPSIAVPYPSLPSHPPISPSLSRISSVSCTCSSASSCSTCINVPSDPSAPHAFTLNPNKKRKSAQRCDQICLVVGSFVTVAVLALTAILLYLALNTKVMTNGMTTH